MTEKFSPLFTIDEAAETVGLTPRRVRQFIQNGEVPKRGRNIVDVVWLVNFYGGTKMAEALKSKSLSPGVLTALGWATACGGPFEAQRDKALLIGLFERNDKTVEDAMFCLGWACGLLDGF